MPGFCHGIVKSWLRDRGFGFITLISPASNTASSRDKDVWCADSAAGGGELLPGKKVWFKIVVDRSGRSQAQQVHGPGVFPLGGRMLGARNSKAYVLEALAAVPCANDELATMHAAAALASELQRFSQNITSINGNPSKQDAGECLYFATFGAVHLMSRLGPISETKIPVWWPPFECALVALVCAGSNCSPPAGERKPGAGGTPGADNAIRYAIHFALDALYRAGPGGAGSLQKALAALPEWAQCDPTAEGLLHRKCHLTNAAHPF